MNLGPDFKEFVTLLNKHEVQYLVVGGFAMAAHGKPQFTGDLDIWIKNSEKNAAKVVSVVKDFNGMTLNKKELLRPGTAHQLGFPPLRIDILNDIDGVSFDAAYKNKYVIREEDGEKLPFIAVEEFLKNKQAVGRQRDLSDIKDIKKEFEQKFTQKNKGRKI